MKIDPRQLLKSWPAHDPAQDNAGDAPAQEVGGPLGGTRIERMHRLQIGASGIIGMVLLVALADIISSRAQLTESTAVPEAAPTIDSSETPAARDPLADAGVVPELPTEPTAGAGGQNTGDVPPPPTGPNAPLQ